MDLEALLTNGQPRVQEGARDPVGIEEREEGLL
jgi:hypothetical protein